MINESEKIRGFEGLMRETFKAEWLKGKGTRLYEKIAIVLESIHKTETYSYLGNFPSIKGWTDERIEEQFENNNFEITNEDWQALVRVNRDDILFDRFKLVEPHIKQMVKAAASGYIKMFINLIQNGEDKKCYDGQPFFSSLHPSANDAKQSNLLKYKLSVKAFNYAKETMRKFKAVNGDIYNMTPNTIIAPPALESAAISIAQCERYNEKTNMYEGVSNVLILNELENDNEWFLADLTEDNTAKPFILQIAKDYELGLCTKLKNNSPIAHKRPVYGIDGASNAGYGFWQSIIKCAGETELS
ncbi:MAG TPA: Mu-like prophage major head subunit gpT family protein [bacterium]|nr:Mu-like prophage major head subunit gpT family protein [bacterium]